MTLSRTKTVGYAWLLQQLNIDGVNLQVSSCIGPTPRETQGSGGAKEKTFTQNYWPGEHPVGHLVFALRHEGVDLAALYQIFRKINPGLLQEYIAENPTGAYARRLGFLYELTTRETLSFPALGGNYTPVLDSELYVTSDAQLNSRWRVRDNLLGNSLYCPTIRRTQAIQSLEHYSVASRLEPMESRVPRVIFLAGRCPHVSG